MSDTALAFVAPTRGPPGWPPDQRSDWKTCYQATWPAG